MIAVKNLKELACCRCKHQKKHRCSNGWICLLTQEEGFPCYADALDRLDNCPLIMADCTSNKIAIGINYQFDKFVIDDREYSKEEVFEILKKYKEEEDKKYNKCERCGTRYLENKTFNMVTHNLDEKPDSCSAWGYTSTPYIRGFRVLSTCGDGREVKLCDDCIFELKKWLTKPTESKKNGLAQVEGY